MKNIYKYLLVFIALITASSQLSAQYLKTAYFMDKSTARLNMNPAFQSKRGYFNIPVVGSIGLGMEGNSLSVDRFLFPSNGKLITFLDSNISSKDFLNGLQDNSKINTNLDLSVIGFGFHTKKSFWTVNIGTNSRVNTNIPKDLFRFLKDGSGDGSSLYNIADLNFSTEHYIDFSLGWSRRINDKLTVGVKLKYLIGLARAEFNFDNFDLYASDDLWKIKSKGSLTAFGKGAYFKTEINENSGRENISGIDFNSNELGFAGMGGAIDLGATYRLSKNILLSAAITDLGIVSWSKKACLSGAIDGEFNYDGFDLNVSDDPSKPSIDDQFNQLEDRFNELIQFEPNDIKKSQSKMLTTRFNIGGEYSIVNDKIGFGLVYYGTKSTNGYTNELVVSTTFRPTKWFSAALSYSFLNTNFDTFGFALNFSPSWINFFIGTDYVSTKLSKDYIPISQKSANLFFGLAIPMTKQKSL